MNGFHSPHPSSHSSHSSSQSPILKPMSLNEKHTLGICAMKKKIHSAHMQQILENLKKYGEFSFIEFTENLIFNTEIKNWPIYFFLIIMPLSFS